MLSATFLAVFFLLFCGCFCFPLAARHIDRPPIASSLLRLHRFDRDLSLAGRVIVRSTSSPATFSSRLIKIDRPLMRIPSLAIHLDRELSNGITVNKETNMTPILGLVQRELNGTGAEKVDVVAAKEDDSDSASAMEATMSTKHHPTLVRLIANELDVQPEDIHDFELSLYDTQPACVGGIENEFIFSPRLDNQMTW